MIAWSVCAPCRASDHLDTRTVVDDPRADIGDLYAWMSPDARRLNLAMTIVGHSFDEKIEYAFHVDSARRVGETGTTRSIACTIRAPAQVDCRVDGKADLRMFAGLRDDPFFNNVKGARDAYQVAAAALKRGVPVDAAHCPDLDPATSRALLEKWRHTDGGPARNFLDGWTPASLVVSLDVQAVNTGGPLLAVWATTSSSLHALDRMGRPLTGNALLAPLAADEVSDALKEQYNRGARADWPRLMPVIQETLGLYDSFDGVCGNQWLADTAAPVAARYRVLAELLADDRLWVDSTTGRCESFMAVERAHFAGEPGAKDCGGRTPTQDAVDVYRSLLVNGSERGVSDGVDRDEHEHGSDAFPFLAAPPAGDYTGDP